jgi:hypothetical protein
MATNGDSPDAEMAGDSRDPSGFLSEIIGAPVTVKLNSGIVYKGMYYWSDYVCVCMLSQRQVTSNLWTAT